MRVRHSYTLVGLRLLLAATAAGSVAIACGGSGGETAGSTSEAEGTCGPGLMPGVNGIGCVPCSVTNTPGSASDYYLNSLFQTLNFATTYDANGAPEYAYYGITSGIGQFVPPPASAFLNGFTLQSSPSQTVSIPSFSGSNYQVVVTNIPSLSVTWTAWQAGTTGVAIPSNMNGTIDAHVTYDAGVQVGADVTINVNQLPIDISFAADSNGDATVPSSSVTFPNGFGNYVSVSNCNIAGFNCDAAADGFVGNAAPALQTYIANQFGPALNGKNNSSPFWNVLLTALANAGLLTDAAHPNYLLPAQGTSSAAGTVSGWVFDSMPPITTTSVSANFTSGGICWTGCTPLTAAQACAGLGCGSVSDHCGDTIQCPDTCQNPTTCDGNYCVPILGCDPACLPGYMCELSSNGPGVCVPNHRCQVGQHFCNNKCVPGTGLCP
jgi:hypothetical protein